MSLTDWLKYLESLPSGLANRSLEHVKSVAASLGVLNFARKVITVAGTNGKGSTVVFLESILLSSGFKTAAYISPHVLNYQERMRINGKDVDAESLCWAFALVDKARAGVTLSYFEFSTLAALLIFKRQNPDFLILEVGLGGNFDAVNIVDPDIAIIATIALDHTHILGNTREEICREKAGIMRPFIPVICGKNMPKSVYTQASKLQAKLYCLSQDFFYTEENNYWDWRFGKKIVERLPLPRLPIANAALALMAIELLSDSFRISLSAIILGLKKAYLLGRMQRLTFAQREIIFDVAHNFEAANLLALNLAKEKSSGRILAVFSMLRDKDIAGTLKPLVNVIDKWYVGILDNARAASKDQLNQCLEAAGVTNFVLLLTVTLSLQQAIAESQKKDKIVVFGSFYTVAEGLKMDLTPSEV